MDTRTQTQTRPLFTQTGHKEHEIVMPEPKPKIETTKFQCKAPLCPYGTNSAMMMGSHHKANPTHRTTEQQERLCQEKHGQDKGSSQAQEGQGSQGTGSQESQRLAAAPGCAQALFGRKDHPRLGPGQAYQTPWEPGASN